MLRITLSRFGEAEKQKTVTLNSCEALHRDLRGLNWSAVGGRLRQQALDIQEMTDRGAGDIRGIKEVVARPAEMWWPQMLKVSAIRGAFRLVSTSLETWLMNREGMVFTSSR